MVPSAAVVAAAGSHILAFHLHSPHPGRMAFPGIAARGTHTVAAAEVAAEVVGMLAAVDRKEAAVAVAVRRIPSAEGIPGVQASRTPGQTQSYMVAGTAAAAAVVADRRTPSAEPPC